MNLQDRIDAIREEMSAKEAAEIARATVEYERLEKMPHSLKVLHAAGRLSFRDVEYNQTIEASFRALNDSEIYNIIAAFSSDDGGNFKEVGLYENGCGIVTAYPYGIYSSSHKKQSVNDAIALYGSAGKGFASFELFFYPKMQCGMRLKVSIRMATMKPSPADFLPWITADYNRSGNVIAGSVRKGSPSIAKHAEKVIPFAAGGLDACSYYCIFNAGEFLTEFSNRFKSEGAAA